MKISEMKKSLHNDVRRNFNAARECARGIKASMPAAVRLMKALNRFKLDPSMYAGGSGKVYFTIYRDYESFKDAELVAILEAAIDVLGEGDIRSHDFPEMAVREYNISNAFCSFEMNARLKGEGTPTCRRVKVGESITTTPKYEFRCD